MAERRTVAQLFEGWQVGAVAVLVAALVTAVIVPRTVEPTGLPPSSLAPRELDRARIETHREALPATGDQRSRALELVDARLRELGRAEYEGNQRLADRWASEVSEAARPVLAQSPETLRALRASQALEFASAYLRSLREGADSDTLVELGGSTLVELRQNGWFPSLEDAGPTTDVVLVGLFKRRFTLMFLGHPELPLSTVEERAVLNFLIRHPPRSTLAGSTREGRGGRGKFVLNQIDALSKLEPSYPTLYARGVVYYEMGQFDAAASAFDAYLQRNQDGPYRLRAVNFLKAAVEESNLMH